MSGIFRLVLSASGLCAEAAAIARSWSWREDDISLQSVMTHAEAVSNRDGRVMVMHDTRPGALGRDG